MNRYSLMLLLCISVLSAHATIRRVNNRTGITGVYTTAQAAHDAALAGDTIMLEPSPYNYGNLNVTKKLVVIGTGFFLTENPETQYKDAWPSTLGTVTFAKSGAVTSEFSQLMGVSCTGAVTVNVSNIILRRNYFQAVVNITIVSDPVAFVTVAENFLTRSLSLSSNTHDIVIRNNIFVFSYGTTGSISGGVAYNGLFMNNVIVGTYYYSAYLNFDNFLVQNNITSYTSFYVNYNSYSNNIADNTSFGYQNGNMQNIGLSQLILGAGTTDGQWQLKPGSLAIGAGNGGVNCGAFGGPNPYVLSGLPPVPATYFFNIGDPSSPYNVQVKVKSHN
jgi:hypothetical protein